MIIRAIRAPLAMVRAIPVAIRAIRVPCHSADPRPVGDAARRASLIGVSFSNPRDDTTSAFSTSSTEPSRGTISLRETGKARANPT